MVLMSRNAPRRRLYFREHPNRGSLPYTFGPITFLLFFTTFAMERAAITARDGISDTTFAFEWGVTCTVFGVGVGTYHVCVCMLYDAAGPWIYVRDKAGGDTAAE